MPSPTRPVAARPSQPSFLKRKLLSLSSRSRSSETVPSVYKRTDHSRSYEQKSSGVDVAGAAQGFGALSLATEPIRRAYGYVKQKLTSKSPLDLLPKSWKDYIQLYRTGGIDMNDPPLPPRTVPGSENIPTPYEEGQFAAPYPLNEDLRQDTVNRLDLFGRKSKHERNFSQSTLELSTPMETSLTSSTLATDSGYSASDADSTHGASSVSGAVRRAPSITSTLPGTVEGSAVDSLENHPAFRKIIGQCRELFSAEIGLLTVLDEDTQMFLASAGVPDGVGNVLPRAASFCGHTILNDDDGMVVLDSAEDWRFAKGLPTAALGVRFYAGSPITATTLDPNNPTVAIGSLCILDTKPRKEFSEAHRRMLKELARQVSEAIEVWSRDRLAARMAQLETSFVTGSAPRMARQGSLTASALSGSTMSARTLGRGSLSSASSLSLASQQPAAPPPALPLPPIPPMSPLRPNAASMHSRVAPAPDAPSTARPRRTSDAMSTISSTTTLDLAGPNSPAHSTSMPMARGQSAPAFALSVTTEDPLSSVPRDAQERMDTGTRLLAKALEVELTYLAAIDLAAPSPSSTSIRSGSSTTTMSGDSFRILAAHGLPSPAPAFDPALHLKALRAPEGGLVYKNPRHGASASSYSAGILIPVLEVRRTGYVLCAYSQQGEREFSQRDLSYMVKFAQALETACIKASR